MRGKPNKLGEGERKVRLGHDRLAIKNGNERKLYTLFYPHPYDTQQSAIHDNNTHSNNI